jgi:hypothetical protein
MQRLGRLFVQPVANAASGAGFIASEMTFVSSRII